MVLVLKKVKIRGRGSGLATFRKEKFFQLSQLAPDSVDNKERKAR
jgi:hypothetical protein